MKRVRIYGIDADSVKLLTLLTQDNPGVEFAQIGFVGASDSIDVAVIARTTLGQKLTLGFVDEAAWEAWLEGVRHEIRREGALLWL